MSRPAISYPIPTNGLEGYDDMSARRPPPPPSETGSVRDSTRSSASHASHGRGTTSTLDSFITRLLVVTKQLLQGLDQWAQNQMTEEEVSDIYVRLGNGFELCVAAFRRVGISTTDLDSVPRDLREILERALAEERSPENLNTYLPDIRAIIFNLLSGLKNKQTAYKRLQTDRQHPEAQALPPPPPQAPVRGMSPRAAASTPDLPGSPGSTSSQSTIQVSRHQAPSPTALGERATVQRNPRPIPDTSGYRPQRTRSNVSAHPPPDHLSNASPPLHQITSPQRYTPTPPGGPHGGPSPSGAGPSRPPLRPSRASRDGSGHGHITSRFSADSDISVELTRRPSSTGELSVAQVISQLPPINQDSVFPEPRPYTGAAPVLPRPPSLNVAAVHAAPAAPALSPQGTEVLMDTPSPRSGGDAPQFITLQALERRASKRFSSYNFNKFVPGSSPQRPSARRSDRLPPMPALREDGRPLSQLIAPEGDGTADETMVIVEDRPEGRPVSMIGPDITVDGPDGAAAQLERYRSAETAPSPAPTVPRSLSVFLQLGRKVKKTNIELPLTQSALRLLFMERFEYDPGLEDFPDVYIRDNRTGVQYELEDMDDLGEGCVLTLDVEPLDQVKQHFDHTFAQLSQEIKELKSSLAVSRRMSMQVPSMLAVSQSSTLTVSPSAHLPAPTTSPSIRPVDRSPDLSASRPVPRRSVSTSSVQQNNRDLERQHDELKNLRTELAVMRQVYMTSAASFKEMFASLRAENTAMREVVKTKMGGSRALLDNSKAKLEAQCQNAIQSVEEVSDIIDGAREDALRRGVTPSRTKMDKIRADLTKATGMVEVFSSDVTLADPTWRATWLTELQRVTEEQRLLAYQNKLAADLKNDIKDATEMLDNVSAFVQQRTAAGAKKFRPASPDQDGGGMSNLLLEIRTQESNPHQRLRAIEEQQRVRQKELASRTDDFSDELAGFVQAKKLRKTGGTEETERVRQRRQDQIVKRMLSGDIPGETPGVLTPQATGTRSASTS